MSLLLKKINMYFINKIASLAALYWIKNFKICNKHQTFLVKHLILVMKKILKKDIISQLDNIWQYRNLLDLAKLL